MTRQPLDDPLFAADDFVDPGGVSAGAPADALAADLGLDALALDVDDLLPAADGSVIFDADVPLAIDLAAGRSVIDSGIAQADAQAGGESVAGYHYVALDDGLTLFYPPEASLVLLDG